MSGLLLSILLVLVFGWVFLNTPAEKLARFIRLILPVSMIVFGLVLLFFGKGAIGVPLAAFGLALYGRLRSVRPIASSGENTKSSVRSAVLEMTLDHDTGEMDGLVLAGIHEGQLLSRLDELELFAMLDELQSDGESVQLLQAYLDRRIPGWREHTDGSYTSDHIGPSGSGSMSKQEAYEVLGLGPDAGPGEIRKAHRRLIKGMHPDSGGSTFLAAKINEAKEVLLRGHS